jgi:hypothetical protein
MTTPTFTQAVREKAAEMANEEGWNVTPHAVSNWSEGRALCRAVQDGLLHIDPAELDKARWEAAHWQIKTGETYTAAYRRLVREGWTPPEPVDPVEALLKEAFGHAAGLHGPHVAAALRRMRLKIVPEDGV